MALNITVLQGNLGQTPELRYTQSGKAVCTLRLAVDNDYRDGKNQLVHETNWFNIVVWGKQAEAAAKSLSKGRQITVEGRLHSRKFETKEGENRNTVEVVARRVQFGPRPQPKAGEPVVPETDAGPADGGEISSDDAN
jgi:single-strand DNA-binding protein